MTTTPQSRTFTFFASCPRGIEELLEKECLNYGDVLKMGSAGVTFKAQALKGIEFLFQTRFASRIFLQLDSFYFESEKELYKKINNKWWHEVFDLNQTFKIEAHIDRRSRENFSNTLHIARVAKDAIADCFREHCQDKRPFVDTKRPDISLSLRIEKSKRRPGFGATMSIDLCGRPLSNRGYRSPGHEAPLRENLAAAIIALTDWPNHDVPLYDPMCGSGTLLIEAICMKKGVAPSFLRIKESFELKHPPYSFFHQMWFKKEKLSVQVYELMQEVVEASERAIKEKAIPPVYGSDCDPNALEHTKNSLEKYGVSENEYELEKQEITQLRARSDKGVLLTNPPYGQRLGENEELKQTYRDIGIILKDSFKNHTAYILTDAPSLSVEIGLKSSRKHRLFNGNLDCRLLKYEVY